MIANLADLVAPMSEQAFVTLLRERQPLHQPGAGAGRYGALMDWERLLRAICAAGYPARNLRVTQRGAVLPEMVYRADGKVDPVRLGRLMEGGASIVAYGLEGQVADFARLRDSLAARLGERISVGVIATTGTGGALPLHYDHTDLVILQIEGEKRWIIDSEPEVDPVPGMASMLDKPAGNPLLDIILRPGDFLFLPAGYRHRCENQSGRSLHAGVFLAPVTAPRVLELLLHEAMADPVLRRPVRVDAADRPEAEAALKAVLLRRIEDLSLEDLIAAHIASQA